MDSFKKYGGRRGLFKIEFSNSTQMVPEKFKHHGSANRSPLAPQLGYASVCRFGQFVKQMGCLRLYPILWETS